MSLFGSFLGDVDEDSFFGSHQRHMRHMNHMMNSLFSDPFGMLGGGGPLAIGGGGAIGMGGGGPLSMGGPRHGAGALMPFMPQLQMSPMNRLFPDLEGGHMQLGGSYSTHTVVMSSGPNGKPQVYSSSSSTKVGPNGIKETRKTLQDSLTGTKKMSIGHHIGERAHMIEREQNVYSGDAEERQEFINLEEDEAEDFDREFHEKAGKSRERSVPAIMPAPRSDPPRLELLAPPTPSATEEPRRRPSARRPLRTSASPLTTHRHVFHTYTRQLQDNVLFVSRASAFQEDVLTLQHVVLEMPRVCGLVQSTSVREVYGGSHPQRRHKHGKHGTRNHDN